MTPGDEGHPQRHLAFVAVSTGTFMATLDASAVNIALPAMARDFGAELGEIEWVVLSYLLALVTLLLNAGRLADLLGRRQVYAAGLLIFGAASLLCGLSNSTLELSLWRVVQGTGGALMNASGPAILTALYPPAQRGRVLGIAGLAVSAGLATGPAFGGFVTGALSWHWIFFPNVPIALVAAWFTLRAVPRSPRKAETFDWVGSALLAGGMGSLLFATSQFSTWGVRALAPAGAAALLLVAFLLWERRSLHPVVDLALFRDRTFTGSAVAGFLVFVTLGAINLVMPFYLLGAQGLSPTRAGAVLTALPLVMALVSPFSGWLADHLGSSRGIAASGASLEAVALLLLAMVAARADAGAIAWILAGLGLAMGLFQSPNNSAMMGAVPHDRLGTAGGMLASVRVTGMLVGNALGAATFLAASGGSDEPAAIAEGLRACALLGSATGLLAALASLARGR